MKNKRDLWCSKILGTEAQVQDTVISLTYKNEHVYVHVNVHSRNLLSSLINQNQLMRKKLITLSWAETCNKSYL